MQNGISQQSPNPPLDRITYIAAITDYPLRKKHMNALKIIPLVIPAIFLVTASAPAQDASAIPDEVTLFKNVKIFDGKMAHILWHIKFQLGHKIMLSHTNRGKIRI